MYLRSVANGNLQRSPQPLISSDWTSCPRSCCLNCVELAVALGTGVALRPYCRFKPGELWESRPPCSDHASKRQRIGIRGDFQFNANRPELATICARILSLQS